MAGQIRDAVGMDLGTTYSVVAYSKIGGNGRSETIANNEGRKTCPSAVAFVKKERIVGSQAFVQAIQSPENLVYDTKRLMGKMFSDRTVQEDLKQWTFNVQEGKNNRPVIICNDEGTKIETSPEEVAAIILREMKSTAEKFLEHEVTDVVITCPASFDDAQRKATIDAARIAGLTCIRLLNEPTAAAVAYGVKRDDEGTVLVFDLGGGTFDASILTIKDGIYEVTGTGGDPHLGGKDLDVLIVNHIMTLFNKNRTSNRVNIDDDQHKESWTKLFKAVEEAKIAVSSAPQTKLFIGSFAKTANGKYQDLNITLSRAIVERLAKPLIKRCILITENLLKTQNVSVEDIQKVVLVGGFTKMTYVQNQLKEKFGDRVSLGVNPDEAVALGAAIMCEVLLSENSDSSGLPKILVDVTPLALGIELENGVMSKIIQPNTPIPTTQEENYTTSHDNQEVVKIVVYQGNRALVKENKRLGCFKLQGIQKMKQGKAEINVKFSISEDGVLSIRATENACGNSNSLVISKDQVGGLSESEVRKMIEDGEKFALQDKDTKAAILQREKLERYISENEDRYPGNEVLADKMKNVLEWLDDGEDKKTLDIVEKERELMDYIAEIGSDACL